MYIYIYPSYIYIYIYISYNLHIHTHHQGHFHCDSCPETQFSHLIQINTVQRGASASFGLTSPESLAPWRAGIFEWATVDASCGKVVKVEFSRTWWSNSKKRGNKRLVTSWKDDARQILQQHNVKCSTISTKALWQNRKQKGMENLPAQCYPSMILNSL